MAGYNQRQLIAAKAGVVGLASVAAGWYLGREEGDYAASILVAAAILGTMTGAYEVVSGWVATWLGDAAAPAITTAPVAPGPTGAALSPEPDPGPAAAGRPVRLGDALKVLATFFAAQFGVWLAALPFAFRPGQSFSTTAEMTDALLRVFPVALPLSMIAGALAVFLLTRRFSRRPGAEPARIAFALESADRRSLLLAAAAGTGLATLLGILSIYAPVPAVDDQGLLARVLSSGPLCRFAFGLTAVLLAPPVEEYVFRGVLLGRLLPTLGTAGGAAVSGTAFWLLHAAEWSRYWPAALGIGAMTVLVTALRLRTRSIVPGIGAHMFYNGTLAVMALLA